MERGRLCYLQKGSAGLWVNALARGITAPAMDALCASVLAVQRCLRPCSTSPPPPGTASTDLPPAEPPTHTGRLQPHNYVQ